MCLIDVDVDVKRNVDESNHSLALFFFQGPFSALNFCDVSSSQRSNKNPFPSFFVPPNQKITTHCFIIDPTTYFHSSIIFTQDFSKDTYESREAKIKIIP